ncbi:MAG: InlB B-repeat-containing protein [Bacilli bacterium]|jgi:uncharacterized repeat protein (TIGR02543 family)
MKKIDIVLLIVMFMFLYGCKPKEKLIISFETNGGSSIEDVVIDSTLDFVLPDDPVKEGYTFAGWYSDIDLTIKYDLNTILTKDITLYADWGTLGLEYELINDETEYSVNKGNASELTKIQIPNIKDGKKVTQIKNQGFLACINLEKIKIPKSIKVIEAEAFYDCNNLTELIIPKTVEIVGEGIVFGTNSLSVIYVEKLTRPVGWHLLWNNTLKPVFWGYLVNEDSEPTLSISPNSEYLTIGKTTKIIPTITNTRNEALTWTSSNTAVATVDNLGGVTGLDFGTTVITATSVADTTISATVTIQVTMEGSGSLTVKSSKTVLAIDSLNESLSVLNSMGTSLDLKDCTFTSSNSGVITISNEGHIQPHSAGTVVINVTHETFGLGNIKLTVVD